jgi:hypothetical protein
MVRNFAQAHARVNEVVCGFSGLARLVNECYVASAIGPSTC